MKQIFFKEIYFSKKSFKFYCHFPKIYALKYFSPFFENTSSLKEIHPKHLYKRKNVFCILLLTYQFLVVGFSLFSKRFFADYRKIDILNERKFGPPRFVFFCLKRRRFQNLVPVSRKNVLFWRSIVSISWLIFLGYCSPKDFICHNLRNRLRVFSAV